MGKFIALMIFLGGLCTTFAQEQENKLVDRLLKPNMSLANSAQNKRFVADRVSMNKQAPSKSFYSPEKSLAKSFYAERTFSQKEFAARHFRTGISTATVSLKSMPTKNTVADGARSSDLPRIAPDSGRAVAVAGFAGNRPFLERGKSQKALSAHNTPLTIEQVRELLNRNK